MDDMPHTTLTQRRGRSGARPVSDTDLEVPEPPAMEMDSSYETAAANETAIAEDMFAETDTTEVNPRGKSAVVKIILWVLVVLVITIAVAYILTNIVNNKPTTLTPTPIATIAPDSFPVSLPLEDGTPTPMATATPTPVAGATATPVAIEGDITVYSNKDRANTGTTAKTLVLNKFGFAQAGTEFAYTFREVKTTTGALDPKMSISYEGNVVTFIFEGVATDNVTVNGNTTTRDFTNVPGITKSNTSNSEGVSKYSFTMDKPYESKITVNKDEATIKLLIKNR